MVIVTQSLTIGQLTFILRVAIQILSLAGPFLIGFIILSNATRLASFSTHDVINRIMGALSVTKSSLKWVWSHIRQPKEKADPGRSFGLMLTILLLVLYGLFSSLSDIGLLGIYTCSIPDSSKSDTPGSVKDEDAARSIIMSNFVNGSNPNTVTAKRCESSEPFYEDQFLWGIKCKDTEWRNSTWLDRKLFSGINTTDSDMLLPLRLGTNIRNETAFRYDTGSKRTTVPTISRGILVNPVDMGFQAIFGVPDLDSQQEFTLDKVMALEVETGCMTLGINTVTNADDVQGRVDVFETNRTWRSYAGPDVLKDILTNYTDAIREHWLPFFNASTLDSNGLYYGNATGLLTSSTSVQSLNMPINVSSPELPAQPSLLGNCTDRIREKFGLPPFNLTVDQEYQCSLVGLSGSMESNGGMALGMTKMLCASISQINLVSATVRKDAQGSISLNYTRLPSQLNYNQAETWAVVDTGGTTGVAFGAPYQRYTLSEDPQGPTSHYLLQYGAVDSTRLGGIASAGFVLSRTGSQVIRPSRYRLGINSLTVEGREALLDPTTITRWSGELGSSLILQSLQYNPWAALDAPRILITSQAGRLAICYQPEYALGFFPLVLAALVILVWSVVMLARTPYRRLNSLKEFYGGLWPYWKVVCPNIRLSDLILIWQQDPNTPSTGTSGPDGSNGSDGPNVRLEVFSPGKPVPMEKDVPMATEYIALVSEGNSSGHN